MTFGTSKVFKSGTGLAMCISKHIIEDQGLEPGCVVQYDMKKLDIKPSKPEHFKKEIEEPQITPA